MRFRDILLEYQRDKTQARWGAALYKRVMRVEGAPGIADTILRNAQSSVTAEVWDDNDRAVYQKESAFALLAWIEDYDPTSNKQYVQWLVQRYCDNGIHLLEDMPRARTALQGFEKLKTSGYFKRNPDAAEWADIGRFKSLSDLAEFVGARQDSGVSNADLDRQIKEKALTQSQMLYDGTDYTVVIPETMFAAQYWGRNTQWCTAAKQDNMFNSYNEAPLYVIIDKKNNRRWQLYFEGYSPQFMDERDEPIDWKNFPAVVWTLFDWPREVFPTMILSAKATTDDATRKAILEQLDNSQLLTAYFWFEANRRDLLGDVIRDRVRSMKSTDILAREDQYDYDDDEDVNLDAPEAYGFELGDLLLYLAAWKPNTYFLHHLEEQFLKSTYMNSRSGSNSLVRPAESFERIVHSSKAASVTINGKEFYCWRGTAVSRDGIDCYANTQDLRIGRDLLGPNRNTLIDMGTNRRMDDQETWDAVVKYLCPVPGR